MSSLLFPGKLVELGPTLYATIRAYSRKPCKSYVRSYANQLSETIERIDDELGLKGHRFILKTLRPVYNGLTMPATQTAYIDPRRPINRLIFTICHEALHLKQVQDDRLIWDAERQVFVWEGQLYQLADNSASEDDWKKLPWEQDVFAKEADLYKKVTGQNELPEVYGRPEKVE
jgi:hypothetical protein